MSLVTKAQPLDHEINLAHPPPCPPITKLPAEILVSIFRILLGILTFRRPRLISVVHVCRFWRNVALNEPSLWTKISSGIDALPPQWIDEFLRRSDPLPLTLRYDEVAGNALRPLSNQRIAEVATESTHRLGKLYLRSCSQEVLVRLNKPAPLLSEITIFQPSREPSERIPKNFLGDDVPLLRDVALHNVSMPLSVKWLSESNLRRLELASNWGLYDLDTGASIPISVSSFLHILTLLPRLEYLSVSFPHLFDVQHSQSRMDSQVHLPYLTFLDVTMHQLGPAHCFRYITAKSPIRLKVFANARERDFMVIEQICSYFIRHSFPPALINWHPQYISFVTADVWDPAQHDHLYLSFGCDPKDMEELSRFILPILLPACNIRVLHIQVEHSSWLDLQDLETIKEIHVHYRAEILRQLLRDSRTACPFPSLRWIHLIGLNLAKDDMRDLKEWVLQRVVVTRLEGLHFQGCRGVPTNDVQLLSSHVKIHWEDEIPWIMSYTILPNSSLSGTTRASIPIARSVVWGMGNLLHRIDSVNGPKGIPLNRPQPRTDAFNQALRSRDRAGLALGGVNIRTSEQGFYDILCGSDSLLVYTAVKQ